MPTLLDLADISPPDTCEGLSMVGEPRREVLYCEALEGPKATRMVHDGHYKLIWYPAGNRVQLFDLERDSRELCDLATGHTHAEVQERLERALVARLYGDDVDWVAEGRLRGFPEPDLGPIDNRGLAGQRGLHYPPPPLGRPDRVVGTP